MQGNSHLKSVPGHTITSEALDLDTEGYFGTGGVVAWTWCVFECLNDWENDLTVVNAKEQPLKSVPGDIITSEALVLDTIGQFG